MKNVKNEVVENIIKRKKQNKLPQIPYHVTASITYMLKFFRSFYYAINMNENNSCDITIKMLPSNGFDWSIY